MFRKRTKQLLALMLSFVMLCSTGGMTVFASTVEPKGTSAVSQTDEAVLMGGVHESSQANLTVQRQNH